MPESSFLPSSVPMPFSPQQIDHVPGEDLGAVGVGAPRGHEERAEGRVAPQLEARVAQVAKVVAGAGQVEGADEAAVGQVEEQHAGAGHPERQPPVVLLLLGAALMRKSTFCPT